jgi:ABC-type cobalamin/Fe3+-siderophores transport system ATPase subunit
MHACFYHLFLYPTFSLSLSTSLSVSYSIRLQVLLHNTNLFLHRGKKYGLLGHNGAGKTTLLRNIASGKIEGMPQVMTRKQKSNKAVVTRAISACSLVVPENLASLNIDSTKTL